MPKKQTSIEYAHIYTNNKIGDEQKLSVQILGEIYKDKDTQSLVVMVDDYSFPDPTFDYVDFTEWLAVKGFKPDLMIRESQLIPLCDEVLKLSNDAHLNEQIGDYIRAKKYPCSLFIATWYLLRLGYISSDIFDEKLVSHKVLNILPESFKPFEEKALEIIKSTKFAEAVDHIEYNYLYGRLVA